MARAPFIPTQDNQKATWLGNFSSKLGTYAAGIGVTALEVTGLLADCAFFTYVLGAKNQFYQFMLDWTAYKNAARDGGSLGAMPVAPVLAAAPAAVVPDIFGRAGALAVRIKNHPGYTESIGRDLGIIGAEHAMLDHSTGKPVLKLTLEAGHPVVGWKKGDADGIELWVDRGDGKGFVFLAIDTIPDYLDTAPLPAPGASAVWKYKGIYRLNDEQVGQWSDIATISVMGA